MSKITQKLISLILAILAVMLIACQTGTGENSAPTSETAGNTSEDQTEETSEEPSVDSDGRYIPNLPDVYYGDEVFTILVRDSSAGSFENWDIEPNEKNRESVNTAITERNRFIEDKYGVKIKTIKTGGSVNGGEMRTMIYNAWQGGLQTYNVANCSLYDSISLAGDGLFYDYLELPNIRLESPWWDKGAMDSLSIAGRSFFGISAINVQLYEILPVIVFNKDLAEQYTNENLYQLVKDGKWTLDKFYEIAKKASHDTDEITGPSVGDQFGIAGQNDNAFCYFYGAGSRTVTLNKYGEPTLTIYNQQNEKVMSKIFDIMTDKNTFLNCMDYVNTPGWTSSPIEFVTNAFIEGRLLFYSDGLLHLDEFADVDFKFGILPVPKYNEEQDDYHHSIGAWGATALVIPTQCPNIEMTTVILEAMSAESKNTVEREYLEKVLTTQSTRDDESEDSIRLITNTKSFDMGACFNWGELTSIIYDNLSRGEMMMQSLFESKEGTIMIEMNKAIQTFTDLPHYTGED